MPYALIGLLVASALALYFVLASNASVAARVVVGTLLLGSVLLPRAWPELRLVGELIQVALAIGLIVYFRLHPDE